MFVHLPFFQFYPFCHPPSTTPKGVGVESFKIYDRVQNQWPRKPQGIKFIRLPCPLQNPTPLPHPTILPLKRWEWKFSKYITGLKISNPKNIWVTNFIRTILSKCPNPSKVGRWAWQREGAFDKMMVRIKFVSQMFSGLLIINPVIHFENFHSNLFSGRMVGRVRGWGWIFPRTWQTNKTWFPGVFEVTDSEHGRIF